jgi:hypothetical protein
LLPKSQEWGALIIRPNLKTAVAIIQGDRSKCLWQFGQIWMRQAGIQGRKRGALQIAARRTDARMMMDTSMVIALWCTASFIILSQHRADFAGNRQNLIFQPAEGPLGCPANGRSGCTLKKS